MNDEEKNIKKAFLEVKAEEKDTRPPRGSEGRKLKEKEYSDDTSEYEGSTSSN